MWRWILSIIYQFSFFEDRWPLSSKSLLCDWILAVLVASCDTLSWWDWFVGGCFKFISFFLFATTGQQLCQTNRSTFSHGGQLCFCVFAASVCWTRERFAWRWSVTQLNYGGFAFCECDDDDDNNNDNDTFSFSGVYLNLWSSSFLLLWYGLCKVPLWQVLPV